MARSANRIKSRNLDRLIVICALLAASVSGFLIFDDRLLHRRVQKNRDLGEPIATLKKSSRDVRRKLSDDVVWFPATNEDLVYQNDSVFTGDLSGAEVVFKDSSKIEISEKSLVLISMKQDELSIEIGRGRTRLTLKAGRRILLKIKGKSIALTGNNAVVDVSQNTSGGFQVQNVSGEVTIQSENQETKHLAENERLEASDQKWEVTKGLTPSNLDKPIERKPAAATPVEEASPPTLAAEPKLELKKEDLSVAKDEIKVLNQISLTPLLHFERLDVDFTKASASSSLLTQPVFGLNAHYKRTLSQDWDWGVGARVTRYTYQQSKSIQISNPTVTTAFGAAEFFRKFGNHFRLQMAAGFGQEIFVSRPSSSELIISALWIPSAILEFEMSLLKNRNYDITLGLGGSVSAPRSSGTVSINTGYGYSVKPRVTRSWDTFGLSCGITYGVENRETSLSKIKNTSLGADIGLIWNLDGR